MARSYQRVKRSADVIMNVMKGNEKEGVKVSRTELYRQTGLTESQFRSGWLHARRYMQLDFLAPLVVTSKHEYGVAVDRDDIRLYVQRALSYQVTRNESIEQLIAAGNEKFANLESWKSLTKNFRRLLEDQRDMLLELDTVRSNGQAA